MATMKNLLNACIEAGVAHFGNLPSGTMVPFGGTTIPDGWLLCNGAAVSRTTYKNLFTAIGTKWGTGDGSTTFNLPNCDSRFLEGTTDASKVGTYLEAGLPNITGNDSPYGIEVESARTRIGGAFYLSDDKPSIRGNNHTTAGSANDILFSAGVSSSIFGCSDTVQPSALQTLMIIKV